MTYDDWKTRTPDNSNERCVRDDSTECDCSRCQAAEERFWAEQGENGDWPDNLPIDEEPVAEPDGYEDLL